MAENGFAWGQDHAVGPGWSPVLQIGRFEQGEAQRLAVAGAGEVELAVFRIYCRVGIENLFPLRHFFFLRLAGGEAGDCHRCHGKSQGEG